MAIVREILWIHEISELQRYISLILLMYVYFVFIDKFSFFFFINSFPCSVIRKYLIWYSITKGYLQL